MTNQQHPITPPPELVEQWRYAASNVPASLATDPGGRRDCIDYIATQAAQWGADQELEACCEWLAYEGHEHEHLALRASRRSKLPSLKEQALTALHAVATGANDTREQHQDLDTIRQALEVLPND